MQHGPGRLSLRQADLEQEMSIAKTEESHAQKDYEDRHLRMVALPSNHGMAN